MPGLPIARPVVFPLAHVGVSPPLPEAVPNPKEKKRACDKAWREANPEKVAANKRAWREANPEKVAATARAWRAANPEKSAANGRAWRAANPEKMAATSRAWRAANPEKKSHNRLRTTGWAPDAFEAAWSAQEGRCGICRVEMETSGRGKHSVNADHCHAQGRPRGLLCRQCNIGLGNFKDEPEHLRAAAIYLEVHS